MDPLTQITADRITMYIRELEEAISSAPDSMITDDSLSGEEEVLSWIEEAKHCLSFCGFGPPSAPPTKYALLNLLIDARRVLLLEYAAL